MTEANITTGSVGTTATPVADGGARPVTVHSINWHTAFDFTQLFRGFRLAINPAKLLMALAAIFVIYMGGRFFDFCWGHQVFSGEIQAYATTPADAFRAGHEQ